MDLLGFASELIRRPSVTPSDAGAMDLVADVLGSLGFDVRRMRFGEIENLYARKGARGPNFCFAGHTDVVPSGPREAWSRDPFSGAVEGGYLHGRGAADMKAAIAAFVGATERIVRSGGPAGTISFLITGDEEGAAVDGTRRVVQALAAQGEVLDACVVGEPTSAERLGDTLKIGRRGSLNAKIIVEGVQGHVAYPDQAANPTPVLVRILSRLIEDRLDEGFEGFQPSNLEVTDLQVGNAAANVIPPRAEARINIRFNPAHEGRGLAERLARTAAAAAEGFGGTVRVEASVSGEAFLTPPGVFTDILSEATARIVGRRPGLSTTGGTSDARFIRALCPVVELGLVGSTMHKIDERVATEDVLTLSRIYEAAVRLFFERS